MDHQWWRLRRLEVLLMERKRLPKVIAKEKWTIYLKETNLYRVWFQKSRHPKGCATWHNASIDVTPQQVSIGHVDFGVMISKSPKVTTLSFGRLTFIWAQQQDLGGHCRTPSARSSWSLPLFHNDLVGQAVWEIALSRMAQRPNGLKIEWLIHSK